MRENTQNKGILKRIMLNPADLGSRGYKGTEIKYLQKG